MILSALTSNAGQLAKLRMYRDRLATKRDAVCESLLKSVQQQTVETADTSFSAIQRYVASRRDEMLNSLLEDETLELAFYDLKLDTQSRQQLQAIVHLLALPIKPVPPTRGLEIRLSGMIAFAAAGAVAGMLSLGSAVHWLLGWPGESGVLVGGPFGAACGVVLLHALAKNPRTTSILQSILITVGIADSGFSLLDQLRPSSWLRKTLFGNRAAGVSLWKRLLAYLGGWIVLSMAKPAVSNDRLSLENALQSTVQSWLNHQIDLIGLCALSLQARSTESESDLHNETAFFEAVRTLLVVANGTEVALAGAALHLQGHLQSRGYAIRQLNVGTDFPVFSNELEQFFDTFGRVSVGDPISSLEPALLLENSVVLRGVVQRVRE